MGTTREDLQDLAKRAAAGKVSAQEFNILHTTILQSIYQESKYREDDRRRDHKELSDKIDKIIIHQEEEELIRIEIQRTLDRHEFILRMLVTVVGIVTTYTIYAVLDRLFTT